VLLPGFVVRSRPFWLPLRGRAGRFAELLGMAEAAEWGPSAASSLLAPSKAAAFQAEQVSMRCPTAAQLAGTVRACEPVLSGLKATPGGLGLWVHSWLGGWWLQRQAFLLLTLPHLGMKSKDALPPSELCFCFGFLASPSPLHLSPPRLFLPQRDAVGGFRNTPSSEASSGGSTLPGFVCGLQLRDGQGNQSAKKCSGGCSGWVLFYQSWVQEGAKARSESSREKQAGVRLQTAFLHPL